AGDLVARVVHRAAAGGGQLAPISQPSLDAVENAKALQVNFTGAYCRNAVTVIPIAIHRETVLAKSEAATCLEQAAIEFVFLAAGLPNPPSADTFQYRPLPQ